MATKGTMCMWGAESESSGTSSLISGVDGPATSDAVSGDGNNSANTTCGSAPSGGSISMPSPAKRRGKWFICWGKWFICWGKKK